MAKPKKPIDPALKSVRNVYGMVENKSGVGWHKIQNAAGFLENLLSNPASPAFRPTNASSTGSTPLAIGGARWYFDNATGKMTFSGQASDVPFGNLPVGNAYNAVTQVPYGTGAGGGGGRPGRKPGGRKPKPGGRKKSGTPKMAAGVLTKSSPYAEADISTTGYIRAQGKAYAAGRGGGASLAGTTGKAGEKKPAKKKPGGAGGGRKRKGLLKVRGHRQVSGVKPGFHISKSGKVVVNKGKKK